MISLSGVFVVTFLAFWYQATNMPDTASGMLFPRVVFADEDEEEDEEDDEDAVPNAVDAYPGEDDFLVFDDGEDRDKDGILDSFAAVVSKEVE